MKSDEHLPGELAPLSGEYEELNVFGRPTGWSVYVQKGQPLPALPRGFTWRRPPSDSSNSFNQVEPWKQGSRSGN
jgi:hypothetical protein